MLKMNAQTHTHTHTNTRTHTHKQKTNAHWAKCSVGLSEALRSCPSDGHGAREGALRERQVVGRGDVGLDQDNQTQRHDRPGTAGKDGTIIFVFIGSLAMKH